MVRHIIVALVLVVAGTQALAFQERPAGGTMVAPPPPAAQQGPAKEAAPPALSTTDGAGVVKPQIGTEVRIPGLGRLGVIPKLDFGLELLYGATETPKRPEIERPDDDGVTIRGTVKHRF